jgi:hypothetical protein
MACKSFFKGMKAMFAVLRQCFVLFAVLALSGCLPSASDADPDKRADAAIELQSFAGGFANASVAAASQTVNNPKWAKGEIAEGNLDSVSLSGMSGQKMSNAFCKDGTGKGYFVSWLNTTSGALNEGVSSGTVLAGLSKVLPQDQIGRGSGKTVKYLNGASLSLSGCTGLDIPANAPVIVNAVKAVPEAAPVVNAENENGDPQFAGARTTLDCGEDYTGEVVKESRLVPGSISQYEWIKVVDTCAPKKQEIDTVTYLNDCGVVGKVGADQAASPSLAYRNNVRVNNVDAANARSKKVWDVSGCEKMIDPADVVKSSPEIKTYKLPQEEMIVGCANSPPAGRETIGQFSGDFTSAPWTGDLTMVRDVTAYGTEADLQNDKDIYNNKKNNKNRRNDNDKKTELKSDVLYGAWEKHSATCNSSQELTITCDSVRPSMAEYAPENGNTDFRYTRNLRAVGNADAGSFGWLPTTYSTWALQTKSIGCQWRQTDRTCDPGYENGIKRRTVTANGSVGNGSITYGAWNVETACSPIPVIASGNTLTYGGKSYTVQCRNGANGLTGNAQNEYTMTANIDIANISGGFINIDAWNPNGRSGKIRISVTQSGSGLIFNWMGAQPGYHPYMCFQPESGSISCSYRYNQSWPIEPNHAQVNCSSPLICRVRENGVTVFDGLNYSGSAEKALNCGYSDFDHWSYFQGVLPRWNN